MESEKEKVGSEMRFDIAHYAHENIYVVVVRHGIEYKQKGETAVILEPQQLQVSFAKSHRGEQGNEQIKRVFEELEKVCISFCLCLWDRNLSSTHRTNGTRMSSRRKRIHDPVA